MIKGGLGNIMKQAQKMQEEMKAAQEQLAREEVTGESGGGMVKIVMNCRHEIKSVQLDDQVAGWDDITGEPVTVPVGVPPAEVTV